MSFHRCMYISGTCASLSLQSICDQRDEAVPCFSNHRRGKWDGVMVSILSIIRASNVIKDYNSDT